MIARQIHGDEEQKIDEPLSTDNVLDPTAQAIRQQIDVLGDDAKHYVLVTPYGGLMDIDGWYSTSLGGAVPREAHRDRLARQRGDPF